MNLCSYIHLNAVRHGLVDAPDAWPYSNYLEWIDKRQGTLVDRALAREYFAASEAYEAFVLNFRQCYTFQEAWSLLEGDRDRVRRLGLTCAPCSLREERAEMIGKAGGPPGTTRLVVITGGPGSGKTSLVTYLGSLGYATVSEAAIQIIHELNAQLGVAGQIAWRQQHPAEFQRRVTYRQAALEAACSVAEGSLAFCDRGRPGAKAYAQLVGYKLDAQVRSLVGAQRYLRVFLLDTLSCLAERPATGRISDRARSLHIHDLLDEAYRSSGYVPCRVPELPILDRARFVLSELGEPGPENARR